MLLTGLNLTTGASAPAILPTFRPYPDLRSNVLKLFADFQVVIVVLVGLVLRIESDAFADEAAAIKHRDDPVHVALQPKLAELNRERILAQSYLTSGKGFLWAGSSR